jgi:hypothetical protein
MTILFTPQWDRQEVIMTGHFRDAWERNDKLGAQLFPLTDPTSALILHQLVPDKTFQ